VETTMTNALIDELTRRRQDMVVAVDEADAVLSGTINGLTTETLSRSATLIAVERRLVVTASITLTDRHGNVYYGRTDSSGPSRPIPWQRHAPPRTPIAGWPSARSPSDWRNMYMNA
jgi:hypothetical protein